MLTFFGYVLYRCLMNQLLDLKTQVDEKYQSLKTQIDENHQSLKTQIDEKHQSLKTQIDEKLKVEGNPTKSQILKSKKR